MIIIRTNEIRAKHTAKQAVGGQGSASMREIKTQTVDETLLPVDARLERTPGGKSAHPPSSTPQRTHSSKKFLEV
jgi:hypothetical protein